MTRINPTLRSLSLLAVFTGCIACAHARAASRGSTVAALEADNHFVTRSTSRRALIPRAEIDGVAPIGAKTAYDVVKQLRPEYLRPLNRRGRVGPAVPPVVFINDALGGGPETLSDISAGLIEQIRYVSPSEARFWYGGGYEGGIIMVQLRRH